MYTYVANNPLKYIDPTGHANMVGMMGQDGDPNLTYEGLYLNQNGYYTGEPQGSIIGAVLDFMWIDDINTILDPNASTFDKTLAGAGFIPIAKVFKGSSLIIKLASKGRTIERAVEFAGEGVEKTLKNKLSSYEQARNLALDVVGDLGADAKSVVGRLPSSAGYGKIVGRQSADGKVLWRLDFDPEKGTHINIEDYRNGKGDKATKLVIPFEGNEDTFKSLLNHLQN